MAVAWGIFVFHCFLAGVLGQGSFIGTPSDVTVISGNDAIITCKVQLNNDRLEINEHITTRAGTRIWVSGQTGPPTAGYAINDTYNLIVQSATYQKGGHYSCKLQDQGNSVSADLIVFENPVISYSPPPDNIMRESQMKSVQCSGQFGGPHYSDINSGQKPTIRMRKDNVDLSEGNTTRGDGTPGETRHTIIQSYNYVPTWEDHGKNLECIMSTTTPAFSYSTVRAMNVEFGVRGITIQPRDNPEPTAVAVGETINCTANGNPEPNFLWSPVTVPTPNPVPPAPVPGKQLTMLQEWMGGVHEWKCEATNSIDNVQHKVESTIEFTVVAAPVGPVGSIASTLLPCFVLTAALSVLRLLIVT